MVRQFEQLQLDRAQVRDHLEDGIAHLQHDGAVIKVDRGGAEMEIVGALGVQRTAQDIEQGDHAMSDNRVFRVDIGLRDVFRDRCRGNGISGGLGDHTVLGLGPGQSRLQLQHLGIERGRREDRLDLGIAGQRCDRGRKALDGLNGCDRGVLHLDFWRLSCVVLRSIRTTPQDSGCCQEQRAFHCGFPDRP